MIPIKIQCECGQKYVFDVEPVGGRLGYAVQCPTCGADGTTAADELIAEHATTHAAPAAGLRIAAPPAASTIPMAPRIPTSAAPSAGFPQTKARRKWIIPAISGVVALICLLAGVALFGGNPAAKKDSATPVAMVEDGSPRTLEELNAWYVEPPAGQNAATFYLQGFNALQIQAAPSLPLLGKGKLPPLGAPMPASMKSALAAFVHSNQEALRFFAQGAKYEQSRYPVDLTPGFSAVLPYALKFKRAALMVELSAISHAEDDDGRQAANDVLTALSLVHSLAAEPALLSQLVRATSTSIAVTTLERTVNRTVLPRESLGDLLKAFQKMEDFDARGEGLNRALAAEHVTWITTLATPQKFLEPLAASGPDLTADRRNQITARLQKPDQLKEEQQFLEKFFRELLAARRETFPLRLKSDELIRQRLTEAAQKKLIITEWLMPGLAGRAANEARCLARLRLGLTAVALEQFRAAHDNRYPAALTELMPDYLSAIPGDPFDGQPLRYRTKGSGYVLYSIGPDQQGDAGELANGKDGDIAFTVVTCPKPAR